MQWFLPVRISAVMLLATSLAFGIGSLQIGLWANGIPGPGLTSFIASVLLLPISLALFRTPLTEEDRDPLRWVAAGGALALGAYVFAMPYLGVAIASALFVLVWIKGLYTQSWPVSLVAALTISAGLIALFTYLLGVPIPVWPKLTS